MQKVIIFFFMTLNSMGFTELDPTYINLLENLAEELRFESTSCESNLSQPQRMSEFDKLFHDAMYPYNECTKQICGEDHISDPAIMEDLQDVTRKEIQENLPLVNYQMNQYFTNLEAKAKSAFSQAPANIKLMMSNQIKTKNILSNFRKHVVLLGLDTTDLNTFEARRSLETVYTPEQIDHLFEYIGLVGAYSPGSQKDLLNLSEIEAWIKEDHGFSPRVQMIKEQYKKFQAMAKLNHTNSITYIDQLKLLRVMASSVQKLDKLDIDKTNQLSSKLLIAFGENTQLSDNQILKNMGFKENTSICKKSIASKLSTLTTDLDLAGYIEDFMQIKMRILTNLNKHTLFSKESRPRIIKFIKGLNFRTSASKETYAAVINDSFSTRNQELANQMPLAGLAEYNLMANTQHCVAATGIQSDSHFMPNKKLNETFVFLGDIHVSNLNNHGKFVLAHEIGHGVDLLIKRKRLSAASQASYRQTNSCLRKGHIEEKINGLFSIFQQGPKNFQTEDYADIFAANVIELEKNPACAFFRNGLVQFGSGMIHTTEKELKEQALLHSNIIFRLLHLENFRKGTLPQSCKNAMQKSFEQFNLKRNCWSRPNSHNTISN